MHPICSWMACIDLCERLRVERLDAEAQSVFDITWDDGAPVAWDLASDLCVRAHALLEEHTGQALPVRVALYKSIPAGGGLGGGSADAGAMLQALRELFDLGLDDDELASLSRRLGSDVAYFLDAESPPRPAIVSGLGDRIERLPRVRGELVLICPPFGCPTGGVYRAYDVSTNPVRESDIRALASAGVVDSPSLFNDLTSPAERVEPRLAELRSRLAETLETPVHMSGSGSTLFVVGGAELAQTARAAAPECRVLTTRLC
ncbi:MAG: hypothetical protein R3B57_05995 [Phycisphaerales bacterium]